MWEKKEVALSWKCSQKMFSFSLTNKIYSKNYKEKSSLFYSKAFGVKGTTECTDS